MIEHYIQETWLKSWKPNFNEKIILADLKNLKIGIHKMENRK